MRTRLPFCLAPFGLLGLIVLLAGCGLTGSAGANSSPPTNSGGPVSIGTDHSQYAGSDAIKVTVTNTLAHAIYAWDTRTSCSILSIEMRSGNAWGPSNAAPCALARAAMLVKIAAGASYTATIKASSMAGRATTFPTGTYRLALQYYTSANPGTSAGTTVYSVGLSVTGSSGSGPSGIPSAPGVTVSPTKP
jgi:hypothetical protein